MERLPFLNEYILNEINLDSVTSATDGDSINTSLYDSLKVWVNVTGNTGAVTVKIEGSPTGEFSGEEVELNSKTYSASNESDLFIHSQYPYLRTRTITHSNATVKTTITGRT